MVFSPFFHFNSMVLLSTNAGCEITHSSSQGWHHMQNLLPPKPKSFLLFYYLRAYSGQCSNRYRDAEFHHTVQDINAKRLFLETIP